MRYKMTYILFLFFLLTTIPYIITIYINKENKKNISFENYDSGYKIQDKDQDIVRLCTPDMVCFPSLSSLICPFSGSDLSLRSQPDI